MSMSCWLLLCPVKLRILPCSRSTTAPVFNVTSNAVVSNTLAGVFHLSSRAICLWNNNVTANTPALNGPNSVALVLDAADPSLFQRNLFNNPNFAFELQYITSASLLNAPNNWWGSASAGVLLARVESFASDAALGLVNLSPYLLSASFNAAAATISDTQSGVISQDTTWSTSPVLLSRNTAVLAGATLAISPGVVIKLARGISLQISGSLVAIGTAAQPIRFTSQSVTTRWRSLVFTTGSAAARLNSSGAYISGSTLQHCVLDSGGASALGACRPPVLTLGVLCRNDSDGQ